ncbi:MAG: DUF1616 domain-containing protein [Saccharolobus sp.]|uniref:DUF1616 domain-containing protein n=1 Tax=Saccharolobus TaxID=2100760 RepID=UPI001F0EBE2E|nr:DUF1616 domain-containing protein [Saccharolobus shibatae]MCH4816722.1 DUF1616 domain-containing protein [Saccharolobus shibatae]
MVEVSQLITQYKMTYSHYLLSLELYRIETYSLLILPLIIFIIYYFFGGKLKHYYYLIWYRLNRKKKIVSLKSGKDPISNGILAGTIIILLIFAFGMYILNTQSKENFSEMAILNSNGIIGNYPSHLAPGENALVYALVQNHEGMPMLYQIKVILEDNNTNITLYTSYNIVNNNGEWKLPIAFAINSTGTFKLEVMLYYYNLTLQRFVYANIFDQLVVSVS